MKTTSYYRVFFFAFAIVVSPFCAQSQSNENALPLIEKFQYKHYDNGTVAGYFTLDGSFTLKDLHRVEQYFIDMEEVMDFSILSKNETRAQHTVFIRSNDTEVSKEWINAKLNQGIAAHKFEVSWAE